MRTSQLYCARECIRHEITDRIVSADSQREAAEDRENFCRTNSDQYYVAINCWLNLIWDLAGDQADHVLYRVHRLIVEKGLIDVIDLATRCADRVISIISGKPLPAELDMDDVVQFESLLGCLSIKDTLQICRFLKRFTLASSSRLETQSYEKFEAIQDRLNWRLQTRIAYEQYVQRDPELVAPTNRFTSRVGYWFNQFFNGWEEELPRHVGHFSGGNCSDGGTMLEKIKSFSKYSYNRESVLYPLGDPYRDIQVYNKDVIRVWGVPKSFKAYRIIAPETAWSSYHLQQLKDALLACMERSPFYKYVDQKDQVRQADRAYYGSVTGSLATFDISGASDGIALYWMKQIMDEDLFQFICDWRPHKVQTGNKTMVLSTFLLSGHPCTFLFETAFFWAILMVAMEEHLNSPFVQKDVGDVDDNYFPSAFGDDMIFNVDYLEEAEILLEAFGIKVNFDKSFSAGSYRESCGVEYLHGHPTRVAYWPRTHIFAGKNPTAEDYASLVSLQHRVYDYPRAADFMEQIVRYFWPKCTSSFPGIPGTLDESTDLWSPFPSFIHRKRPYGKYWDSSAPKVDCPSESYSIAHSGLKTLFAEAELVSDEECDLLQVWLYTTYLEEGPKYDDKLSELLRVSTRRDIRAFYMEPNIRVDLLT